MLHQFLIFVFLSNLNFKTFLHKIMDKNNLQLSKQLVQSPIYVLLMYCMDHPGKSIKIQLKTKLFLIFKKIINVILLTSIQTFFILFDIFKLVSTFLISSYDLFKSLYLVMVIDVINDKIK